MSHPNIPLYGLVYIYMHCGCFSARIYMCMNGFMLTRLIECSVLEIGK